MIVKINGKIVSEYVTNEIVFNYDAVSDTFSLTVPFFEHWPISRELYRPLHYQEVLIFDDSMNLLLTGTMLNYKFKSTANANEVSISGYSRTGILDDCPNVQEAMNVALTATEDEAIEAGESDEELTSGETTNFSDVTLLELATKLVAPFRIEILVDEIVKNKMNETYEQTTTDGDTTIAQTLAKLATLKNVVMRCTKEGKLLFTQIDPTAKPKARFSVGDGTVNEISLDVNGQNMHSKIYLLGAGKLYEDDKEDKERTNEEDFIVNPLVKIDRPTILKQGSETTRIADASKAALANELKNITVTIDCKGWKMIDENIISCGDIITVFAPDVFIRRDTNMIIRSITLKEDAKGKHSSLSCVLVETITGDTPFKLFDI